MGSESKGRGSRYRRVGSIRWRLMIGGVATVALATVIYSNYYYADQVLFLRRLFPSGRTSCALPPLPPPSASAAVALAGWRGGGGGGGGGISGGVSARTRRPDVGIVLLYDDQVEEPRFAGMESISALSIANKRAYAEAHGYSLHVADGSVVDRSRPAAWSKLLALRTHLPRHEWLLFMDMDTLVMNPALSLEASGLLDGGDAFDVVMSEDWSGANTGVFLLRNSSWSNWLLEELWRQEALVGPADPATGRRYPFEYEQRAVHLLLQTDVWRARGLPPYDGAPGARSSTADVRAHFRMVPQCALNSYMLSPLALPWAKGFGTAARTAAQYAPGDFVVHMAGHKGVNKVRLFEECAREAARSAAPTADHRASLKRRRLGARGRGGRRRSTGDAARQGTNGTLPAR